MKNELPFLKLEFTGRKVPGTNTDEMHFVLKGDPVILTKAIRTVMQARQDFAAAMMAVVIDYCLQEGD